MARTYLLFVQATAALIAILAIHQAKSEPGDGWEPASFLKLEAFRVSARVRIIRSGSNQVDHEILVDEHYSNLKQRSRLDIKFIDRGKITEGFRPKIIQYFYDGSTGARQLIRLTNNRREDDCALVDGQKLADDLFGELSSADQHMTNSEWLKGRPDVPDYVIGFARMLVVADANKKRMRQVNEKMSALIRNRKATKYSLQDELGSSGLPGDESKLLIYFGKSKDETDELPLRIWFVQATRAEIIVDYSRFSRINFDVMAANDFIGTYHSFLMFPLQTGCSSLLAKADLIQQRPAPKLISFRMHVMDSFDDSIGKKYFIAYDSYTGVLRRDQLDATSDSASTTTIYDYRANRKYNIRYGQGSSASSRPPAGSGEFNAIDTGTSQCAVASIEHEQPPEFEPLLPLKDMVWMGHGFVRGIEVLVFEQIRASLPAILVTQANTEPQLTNATRPIKSDFMYSIIYYFVAPTTQAGQQGGASSSGVLQMPPGQDLGPLIRVKATKKGLTHLVIDLEEFLWQLADAPNGDRSTELFSLRDACYGDSLRRDSFVTLKLDLNVAYSAGLIGGKQGQKDKTPDETYTALSNPLNRNKGLVRALSGATGLSATMIYDMDSRLYRQDAAHNLQVRIHADARLKLFQNPVLYEAVYVGSGAWWLSTLLTDAENFDDCFWDAMHLRRSGEVLFTFCFTSCRIDQGVELEYSNSTGDKNPVKVMKSEGFDFGTLSSCKIYSLKLVNDGKAELASKAASPSNVREKLKANLLALPLPYGAKVDQVQLTVKMIQIGNDRWSLNDSSISYSKNGTSGGVQTMINEGTLKGIGLTIGTDGLTTRVQPKQTSLPVGGDDDEDGGPATEMSYSLCHSICLATVKCRSFSLCAGSGQLECMISELEFRDPDLLARVAQQVSESRNMSRRATTTISVQQVAPIEQQQRPEDDNEQDVEDNSKSVSTIELRVDRRCHLYNKQALELFHPPGSRAAIEMRSQHLVPVDSAEQCAEICLQRNKRFFKRATKRRKQALNRWSREEKDDESSLKILARLRAIEGRNLGSWCRSFGYIDLNELRDSSQDSGASKLDPTQQTKSGLCYPTRGSSSSHPYANPTKEDERKKMVKANETSISLPMHKFDFLYSSLYEPQYGLKLRPFNPTSKNELEQLTRDEIREFLRDGNIQVVSRIDDVEVCARICFLQMVDLEPWCQSFGQYRELVVKTPSGNKTDPPPPELQSYCIFNTITMAAALKSSKSGQLTLPVTKNISFIHYEPRNMLNLETVIMDQLLLEERASARKGSSLLSNLLGLKYSRTGIMILLALSLASGLALVQYIVPHLVGTNNNNNNTAGMTTGASGSQSSSNNNDGGILAKISGMIGRTNRKDIDLARLVKSDDEDYT